MNNKMFEFESHTYLRPRDDQTDSSWEMSSPSETRNDKERKRTSHVSDLTPHVTSVTDLSFLGFISRDRPLLSESDTIRCKKARTKHS